MQENELYLSENLQYAIHREKVLSDTVEITARNYEQFLRGNENELIIFKTDFVDGRNPLTAVRYAFGTMFELDYEELAARLHTVFDPNRIGRAGELSLGTQQVLYKKPTPITEKLMEFCGLFPDEEVEVDSHFELLKGSRNPPHGLRIEQYIDYQQLLTRFPLGAVWTVVKIDEGFSNETAVIPFRNQMSVKTQLRRVA
ncbi:MAG: hypothetical protein A2798_03405 [Candidatus Levybacteria bacterium RIFCSPHIGHO2_01_FULL_37_17]|nr:MAG: hypothetical protein A2798_03405 [Candidatus Levybacteria bacterium RIFCSPHIGHO2_01_FULL_37_17]OGH36900.1 MAG: hypothetical protein A2959_01395 [Candidatus Levybacteria bacterium RIFCSPLOWO2_01_FULL_38_23]